MFSPTQQPTPLDDASAKLRRQVMAALDMIHGTVAAYEEGVGTLRRHGHSEAMVAQLATDLRRLRENTNAAILWLSGVTTPSLEDLRRFISILRWAVVAMRQITAIGRLMVEAGPSDGVRAPPAAAAGRPVAPGARSGGAAEIIDLAVRRIDVRRS